LCLGALAAEYFCHKDMKIIKIGFAEKFFSPKTNLENIKLELIDQSTKV